MNANKTENKSNPTINCLMTFLIGKRVVSNNNLTPMINKVGTKRSVAIPNPL
jgi:hypothetical protein